MIICDIVIRLLTQMYVNGTRCAILECKFEVSADDRVSIRLSVAEDYERIERPT